jgi:hypothetical protein
MMYLFRISTGTPGIMNEIFGFPQYFQANSRMETAYSQILQHSSFIRRYRASMLETSLNKTHAPTIST